MKSGHFDANFVSVAGHGTVNTEVAIPHGLGGDSRPAIPRGYIVVRRNAAASLYDSTTPWTTTTAYLKSDTALARFTVMFFA